MDVDVLVVTYSWISKQHIELWIIVLKHVIHSQQTVQMLQVQTVMQNDNIQHKFTSGNLIIMQSAGSIISINCFQ